MTEYETISENDFFKDAACLTWVRGIKPKEALNILERKLPFSKNTFKEVESTVRNNNAEAILAGVLSNEWILMVKENSFLDDKELITLSKDTVVITVFWNVNGLAVMSIAKNGELLAELRDIVMYTPYEDEAPLSNFKEVEGKDPDLVLNLVNNLKAAKDNNWKSSVFMWISDYVNSDLPQGWLQIPHETSIATY